jgi:hypothetical protein
MSQVKVKTVALLNSMKGTEWVAQNSQEIPQPVWNPKLFTVFTTACYLTLF